MAIALRTPRLELRLPLPWLLLTAAGVCLFVLLGRWQWHRAAEKRLVAVAFAATADDGTQPLGGRSLGSPAALRPDPGVRPLRRRAPVPARQHHAGRPGRVRGAHAAAAGRWPLAAGQSRLAAAAQELSQRTAGRGRRRARGHDPDPWPGRRTAGCRSRGRTDAGDLRAGLATGHELSADRRTWRLRWAGRWSRDRCCWRPTCRADTCAIGSRPVHHSRPNATLPMPCNGGAWPA